MDFRAEFENRQKEINEILMQYMPDTEGLQKTVKEAMHYSLEAGGKRIRPMLMRETYKMFGGTGSAVEPFMAAMEMIHTYSLVHDDLQPWTMTSCAAAKRPPGWFTETVWRFWQGMPC